MQTSSKRKIALYGGTFDPLHFGHIQLALSAYERLALDEVWFSPAQVNPHKIGSPLTDVEHRLEMLRLGLADLPAFKVLDREAKRLGPSYTIDTIRDLLRHPPIQEEFQLFLLLGADAARSFFGWHEPEEIVKLVTLIIGSRKSDPMPEMEARDPTVWRAIEAGWLQTPMLDISATEIRERLRQQKYCGHLMPKRVIDYARNYQLYEQVSVNKK